MKKPLLVIPPDKILFIAEGQLGDNLLLGPALRAYKEKFPQSSVTVLLMQRRKYNKEPESTKEKSSYIYQSNFEGTSEVYKDHPYVDKVIELDRKRVRELKGAKRLKAEWECISYIRKQKFSAVVCTFASERFTTLAFLSGIKMRIGDGNQKLSYLLNVKSEKCTNDLNVLEYYCCLLEPLGVKCTSNKTFFNIPQKSVQFAESFFKEQGFIGSKKIIAIHPGASLKSRQVPPQFFAKLINMLIENGNYYMFLCYSEFDSGYVQLLKKYLDEPVPEVQTQTISDLAALLKNSDLAILHASGPRHLAAAVGTRTMAFIQAFDDKKWEIYQNEKVHSVAMPALICERCEKDNKCYGDIPEGESYGSHCMRTFDAADVYSRVVSLLNNNYF